MTEDTTTDTTGKRGRLGRSLYRVGNLFLPLRETAKTAGEARQAGGAIADAGKALMSGLRAATDGSPPTAEPLPVPTGKQARTLSFRARVTWCIGALMLMGAVWIVGVWLSLEQASVLQMVNFALGALMLTLAGLLSTLQSSALWHSLSEKRWISVAEVIRSPARWVPV